MQQNRINLKLNTEKVTQVLQDLVTKKPQNLKEIDKVIRKHQSVEHEVFSKSFLLTSYETLKKENLIKFSSEEEEALYSILKMKETRTISGVTPVTVLTKPFPCPGKCIFCPNDVRMPKSYLSDEPGAQRALSNKFDPYLQTFNRLLAFKNTGHPTDKIELIILGGTWSSYPETYQIWFVKRCFDALNDFENQISNEMIKTEINLPFEEDKLEEIDGSILEKSYNQVISHAIKNTQNLLNEVATWDDLKIAHEKNIKSKSKCVGLVIETRPDEINENEVIKIRKLGATKIQIGIQSLNDEVLKLNKRGHDVAKTKEALDLIRRAGFKIHGHYMPNLYGSTPELDKEDYLKLFNQNDFKPDELKIYPCSLIKTAELMKFYNEGLWKPYTQEELAEVVCFTILNTPRYCRLTRIIRDIPSTDIVVGNKLTNFRQIAEELIKKSGKKVLEIRSREIKNKKFSNNQISIKETAYETTSTNEIFLEYVNEADEIFGFLRLSLPKISSFIPELKDCAIIREVHIYGQSTEVGKKDPRNSQHQGLGKNLIKRAEELAIQSGFAKLAVISAIGTREYYQKNGFELENLYQVKNL
jgi:elongator complex protein 3